jgi:D-galactarolactone cycloisomerase
METAMQTTEVTEEGTAVTARTLTIESIEVIPMRVPLARRFQGSHYSMTSRCTIVTRVHTSDGLVSEVYNGDTDAEQAVIVGIIRNEIAPQLIGRNAFNI